MLSLVTVGAVPEHRCKHKQNYIFLILKFIPKFVKPNPITGYIDGFDTDSIAASWNSTSILDAIPLDADGDISSCFMYSVNKSIVPCEKYIYDRTYYATSRAIDWNFVCDKVHH